MLPLALACLAYFAWNGRAVLLEVYRRADFTYLSLAAVLWIVALLVSPLLSMLSLSGAHQSLDYETAFKIHAQNILARYIPGGVWHTVGRIIDFRDLGITRRQLAAFVFLENSLAASVTLTTGGTVVWYVRGLEGWGGIGALGVLGGTIGLVLSRFIVNRWILQPAENVPLRIYLLCVTAVGLFWIFAASAFVSYSHAFPGQGLSSAPRLLISGGYLLAWGLGFLALFAPQGVGVFEVVLASLISDSLSLGTMAVLIAGFRILTLCADLTIWLISRVLSVRGCFSKNQL